MVKITEDEFDASIDKIWSLLEDLYGIKVAEAVSNTEFVGDLSDICHQCDIIEYE